MIRLNINKKAHDVDVPDDMPLLWVLRDVLDMKGTKYGCGIAQCGACTVHIDGVATRACITPVSSVGDSAVITIEGLPLTKTGLAVKAAWLELDVMQCGYCQNGQVMTATALLAQNPRPSDDDIDAAMDGNLCRCATYKRIRAAIKSAAGLDRADRRSL